MQSKNLRELTKMSLCVALNCVAAYISFPLPFTPGMVTALTFTLSLTAYLLSPRRTFTVVAIYILLGAIGLPVLGGGQSLSRLIGPTGGFYLAWVIAYPILSAAKGATPSVKRYVLMNALLVMPITYAGGLMSMLLLLDVSVWQAFTMAVFPFIPGDIIKAIAAAFLGVKLKKILGRQLS